MLTLAGLFIGIGIALAGFFIGLGLECLGKQLKK